MLGTQIVIKSFFSRQLLIGSMFQNVATFNDNNQVSRHYGRETMGDCKDSAIAENFVYITQDDTFRFVVCFA